MSTVPPAILHRVLERYPWATLDGARTPQLALDLRLERQEWEISGAFKGRLPGPWEADLYVALHALWNEQGRPADGRLRVRTLDLLQRMGKQRGGKQYDALAEGLGRLNAVRFYTRMVFTQAQSEGAPKKRQRTRGFGLLDAFTADDGDGWTEVRLSAEMCATLTTQGRALDAGRYFRLDRPASRRLFRYLDRRRYRGAVPQPELALDLAELAAELPIRSTTAAEQRKTLEPAHAELMRDGFLRAVHYTGRGHTSRVHYTFSSSGAGPSAPEVGRTVGDRVEQLLGILRDPQSVGFYAEVAKGLPDAQFDHLVGSIREQVRDGMGLDTARKIFTAAARARMKAASRKA